MKIENNPLYAGVLLGMTLVSSIANAEQIPTMPSKATAQVINTQHAQHVKNKSNQSFNPPRQMSPHQFQQFLQNNREIDDLYKVKKASLVDVKHKQSLSEKPSENANVIAKSTSMAPESCTSPAQLQGLSGNDLVTAVKAGELTSCLYGLFDTSLVGTNVFSDQSVLTIVTAINSHLVDYTGTNVNSAAELEKLVIYLRAMHWAEWGNNRVMPAGYQSALEQVFEQYFSAEHFVTFNGDVTRDFMVRYELLILLSSSGTNSMPYIARITDAVLGYAKTVNRDDNWGVYYEENGFTQLLTHLFNASENKTAELEQAVINTPSILSNLQAFVDVEGTWLIGHTREYQWGDSVNELARFLRFGGSIAATVRPSIQAVLANYSYQGTGSSGWLKAQSAVTFYDSENCALYGDSCDFDLQATVLSGNHVCSSTLKLRFQPPIANENLVDICQTLSEQEQEFHQLFNTTAQTPVEDDYNTDLEVVIFSSYNDYDNFAGNFFGINTNNGGMYLEGDPWVENNQARFIAHQATWLSEFAVWNLEHEYVHYLDGRFNKWGNFSEQAANSVWWGEGLAEYLSQPDNNPNALAVAPQATYNLSELFQTTYENSDTTRTYYWGYLATRFMLEQQTSEIDNVLLPSLRAPKRVIPNGECQFDWGWKLKTEAVSNNWSWAYDDSEWSTGDWVWTCGQPQPEISEVPAFTPYQEILNTWGTSFDEQFSQWLVCLVAGEGVCQGQTTKPADLDENGAVDIRDINLFKLWLREQANLSLDYDFNKDGMVDRRDVRPMMALCDLARCAIAP
ncbi:collagenase [Thalassotalea castellviae]|uniref:microbial collagenase n=1 Tax=Thalassotalea castellviae TaxID=3075612 RepID=A0ABU3A111_9GAMM|nr:collagenase [Thalassotalea sp. W431]MDT0603242.1 collagenase [Thalassotalea sp. W431]